MTAPPKDHWELLIPISDKPSERFLRSFTPSTPIIIPTREQLLKPVLDNDSLPRFVPLGSVIKVHSWPKL